LWQDKTGVQDISEHLTPTRTLDPDHRLAHIAPAFREAFTRGRAGARPVALPEEFSPPHDGHEAATTSSLMTRYSVERRHSATVNAWAAARYTLPPQRTIRAAGGARLTIPTSVDAPT